MIDAEKFNYWFTVLRERCGASLSAPTIALYYKKLSARMTTEEFCAVADRLFESHETRKGFPSPADFAEVAGEICKKGAFAEYSESDEIEASPCPPAVRAQIQSLLSQIGRPRRLASAAMPSSAIDAEIAEKTRWLADPILRSEAMQWAQERDDIRVVTDEESGVITGFEHDYAPVGAVDGDRS